MVTYHEVIATESNRILCAFTNRDNARAELKYFKFVHVGHKFHARKVSGWTTGVICRCRGFNTTTGHKSTCPVFQYYSHVQRPR